MYELNAIFNLNFKNCFKRLTLIQEKFCSVLMKMVIHHPSYYRLVVGSTNVHICSKTEHRVCKCNSELRLKNNISMRCRDGSFRKEKYLTEVQLDSNNAYCSDLIPNLNKIRVNCF